MAFANWPNNKWLMYGNEIETGNKTILYNPLKYQSVEETYALMQKAQGEQRAALKFYEQALNPPSIKIPKELIQTPLEWLREQVDSVCQLAHA